MDEFLKLVLRCPLTAVFVLVTQVKMLQQQMEKNSLYDKLWQNVALHHPITLYGRYRGYQGKYINLYQENCFLQLDLLLAKVPFNK